MDVFVPNPSMNHFSTSPHSLSIYDHSERLDIQTSFCGGNTTFTKPTVESLQIEEFAGLDDKIEDSNLKYMCTPEVMNALSLSAPSSSFPSSIPLDSKPPCTSSESTTSLTLNEINMDNDMPFPDFFNFDADDSKFSFSSLDLYSGDFKSNPSSSCHTPVPQLCVEPMSITDLEKKNEELVTSNITDTKPVVNNIGENFLRKIVTPMKVNFPPREAQPQLIGVVAPVKKPEMLENNPVIKEAKPDIMDLKSHLYNFKNSNADGNCRNISTVAYSFSDISPQIVPSCETETLKRSHDKVKTEPDSPASKKLCMDADSHDILEDFNDLLENKDEDYIYPQRQRYDSGGSGHMSDILDDDLIKDGFASDDDDDYSDIDADISSMSPAGCESLIDTGKKQKQFFWQYNVQAKGPKGTRLKLAVDSPKDFHILNDFEDPVFDEGNTVLAGIRHGGKARKGDGNEISPNPKKLFHIGHQLLRLNKKINACQLGPDMPASKRNESRKEKNKLASRACRMKKKAQHEANKIKLHGLEKEHTQLNQVVSQIWPVLRERTKEKLKSGQYDAVSGPSSLGSLLENLVSKTIEANVAKATTDYVNGVVLKVEAGDPKGGLNIHSRKT